MTESQESNRIKTHNSNALPSPGRHYSHVSIAAGMAYISGLLPIHSDGSAMSGRSFDEQTIQILKSLDACLHSVGLGPNDLVQVRIYLTNMDNWPRFNEHYAAWLQDHRPARIILGVSSLHFGVDIEVEAVALACRTRVIV